MTALKPKSLARFRRENLGFVFQDFNLLDTLTISENIALALTINKVPARAVDSRVSDIAKKLNITDILHKYPYQVSGGQKQRCACARAIVNNPKLLLADEPTGALDSRNGQEIIRLLKESHEIYQQTLIIVTHDETIALQDDRIITISDGNVIRDERQVKHS